MTNTMQRISLTNIMEPAATNSTALPDTGSPGQELDFTCSVSLAGNLDQAGTEANTV